MENSGKELRNAVLEGEKGKVEFLLAHGADINYQEVDMIFTFGGTSLSIAVGQEDFEMVKYLVAQGADISIPDKIGVRPYHRALEIDNLEIAQYLRNMEEECIAYYETGHEWYGNMADFEKFRRNAADYVENIFNEW